MREVGIADGFTRLIEHLLSVQIHKFQVRFEVGKVLGLQRRQEAVGPVRRCVGQMCHGLPPPRYSRLSHKLVITAACVIQVSCSETARFAAHQPQ